MSLVSKLLLVFILVFYSAVSHSECVILLHGLVRSDGSMKKIERALTKESYDVVNVDYPSRDFPIEVLAEKTIKPVLEKCPEDQKVNFVTHSLGGILVRQYLSLHEISELHRVVMLGPPNKGSEVVDMIGHWPGFDFVNGEAGLQLGTDDKSIPNTLGAANFDVGIIAGTASLNFIFSSIVPGEDDGTVSVESTKLQGMNDHIKLPVSHTFMMNDKRVIMQVIHYLKHGNFIREQDN